MKKLFLSTISSIFLTIFLFSVALADVTVTGRVLNDCPNGVQSLEGALIELTPNNTSPIPSSVNDDVYTDGNGYFSITVPDGEYVIRISYFNHVLFAETPIKFDYGDIHVSEPSACKDSLIYLPVIMLSDVSVQSSSTILDYANVTHLYAGSDAVYEYNCYFYGGTQLQVTARFDELTPPFNTVERMVWSTNDAAIAGIGCEGSPAIIYDPSLERLTAVRFTADSNTITVKSEDFKEHWTLYVAMLFR